MSTFVDLVVKLERRKLGKLADTLPEAHPVGWRRIWGPKLTHSRIKHVLFLIVTVLCLNVDFHLLDVQTYFIHQTYGLHKLLATIGAIAITWVSYKLSFWRSANEIAEVVVSARHDRGRYRVHEIAEERKATELKARAEFDERYHAITQATIEADRRNAVARLEAQRAQERSANEWRNAVIHMESGLRQVLHDYRKRAYWVPETADEEALYEKIRLRIRQADTPEFGILRRSTDGVVTMILGDRSCLPPEPPEGFLTNRTLKPVGQLLEPVI